MNLTVKMNNPSFAKRSKMYLEIDSTKMLNITFVFNQWTIPNGPIKRYLKIIKLENIKIVSIINQQLYCKSKCVS